MANIPLIKDSNKPCITCGSIEFHLVGQINLRIEDDKLMYEGATPTNHSILYCSECDSIYRFCVSELNFQKG